MIVIENFPQVAAQIEKERGINKELLLEAISAAMIAATRKKIGKELQDLEVEIDEETGEAFVFAKKEVVKELDEEAEHEQITIEEAREYQDDVEAGDTIMIEVTPEEFGRIAAQTAKQVIMQKIREAEKTSIYDEFKDKEGTIINGYIQRKERNGAYLVNLGRIEAILPLKNQIPKENYNLRDRIRVYLVSVETSSKGPQMHISRSHPGLIHALFKLEIPEIQEGIIEVVSVARDVGSRAKVAVRSNDSEIGAVGTCVGHMGGRIQNIVKELGNERIDIIEWSDDPYQFIANALKPAKINKITLEENEGERRSIVNVDEDQLSLAIGRSGQNVRLAAKLTGWKIDVESQKSSLLDNLKSNIAEELERTNEEAQKEADEQNAQTAEEEVVEDLKDTNTSEAAQDQQQSSETPADQVTEDSVEPERAMDDQVNDTEESEPVEDLDNAQKEETEATVEAEEQVEEAEVTEEARETDIAQEEDSEAVEEKS